MQELLQMTIEDCGKEQKPSSSQAKVVEGHPWPRSPFLTNMPDQRELSSPSMVIGEQQEIRLSEEEAYDLAAHLKQRLQEGTPLDADPDSNVRVPFSLLSQSYQCFRAAGFGVEAINADPTAPQVTRTSPEAKPATKAATRKKAEPTPAAKKEAAPTRAPKSGGRRGRRKAS